jgi:hypothetical protein
MNSTYRVVFIGENWSMTVFVDVEPADLVNLPLNGTITDGLLIDGIVAVKADNYIKEVSGVGPAEHAVDVEVERWAHAKA